MRQKTPKVMYILLGDLDILQHQMGSLGTPEEWQFSTEPGLSQCGNVPRHRLVSQRNPIIFKEPILDGVRDVEMYNSFTAEQGVWPDLIITMKPGWQIQGPIMNLASHGASNEKAVVLVIKSSYFPAGVTCQEPANLADIAPTLLSQFGLSLPFTTGQALSCSPGQ